MRGFSPWFRIAVAASIVAGVSAAGQLSADAGPISEPDFYTNVPADLTLYAPGDVIHWEPETDLGPKFVELSAYRVMYRSDGSAGDPVAEVIHGVHPERRAPGERLARRRVGTRHVGHR